MKDENINFKIIIPERVLHWIKRAPLATILRDEMEKSVGDSYQFSMATVQLLRSLNLDFKTEEDRIATLEFKKQVRELLKSLKTGENEKKVNPKPVDSYSKNCCGMLDCHNAKNQDRRNELNDDYCLSCINEKFNDDFVPKIITKQKSKIFKVALQIAEDYGIKVKKSEPALEMNLRRSKYRNGKYGHFSPSKNLMTIYLRKHTSEEGLYQTYLHEMAHFIVGRKGGLWHGATFKNYLADFISAMGYEWQGGNLRFVGRIVAIIK